MLRDRLLATHYAHEEGFRWRGHEISRLEGLSDAVFAFAITLLVVSLEVPRNPHEVVEMMRGFGAFAFTFYVMYRLWELQYRFFRRYGLEDPTTRALNGALLFLVLFFTFPLKFFATGIANWIFENGPSAFRPRVLTEALQDPDTRALILALYFGWAGVMATLGLLYLHAWQHRRTLELSELEEHTTRATFERLLSTAAIMPLVPAALLVLSGDGHKRIRLATGIVLELVLIAGLVRVLARSRHADKRRRAMTRAAAGSIQSAQHGRPASPAEYPLRQE